MGGRNDQSNRRAGRDFLCNKSCVTAAQSSVTNARFCEKDFEKRLELQEQDYLMLNKKDSAIFLNKSKNDIIKNNAQ